MSEPIYELKRCPFCGESLVKHDDHHGGWYAHRQEPGPCIDSCVQILDTNDAKKWNTRPIESALEAKLAKAVGCLRTLRTQDISAWCSDVAKQALKEVGE